VTGVCEHCNDPSDSMKVRGGRWRGRVPVGSRIAISYRPDRFWGPPSLLSNGYRGLSPRGVKQQEREADHSSPTSAETKKTWMYTSTRRFHGVGLA
jgi:hypothetical protein